MFKYILKRLGLSVIVLLGVSVIIYFLVRLMPTDYLETKFSSQLQQGTMTYEQLDDFKKRYGLYMPEAYTNIEIDGYDTFVKDTKVKSYEGLQLGNVTVEDFFKYYAGRYENSDDTVLELNENGIYRILDASEDTEKVLLTGRYEPTKYLNDNKEQMATPTTLVFSDNAIGTIDAVYETASVWDKFVAVLGGYFSWLGNMLRGDLGDSFLYQLPVGSVIADHMWVSFLISLVALIFQFTIAILLGIISATRQYSAVDYSVTVITMIGISLPSFFFAALLIKVFSSWLGWFPASGLVSAGGSSEGFAYFLDMLHHLALPMLVLIVLSIGGLMRYTRTNMLEVLNSDYIRTARSKGLSEKKVIYVHAFRNTMIPLMTLLAGILPSLFGGAMITEEVFAIDGIGRLAYKALQQGDVPFIMGYNMFLAVLTVIGTLLSDLMYAVVDPRVKLAK